MVEHQMKKMTAHAVFRATKCFHAFKSSVALRMEFKLLLQCHIQSYVEGVTTRPMSVRKSCPKSTSDGATLSFYTVITGNIALSCSLKRLGINAAKGILESCQLLVF